MTGSVSSPGVGSKLDVKTIVSQLTALESKPIDLLAAQQKTVQAKLSSFGLLKNFIGNLKDAAARLADPSLWKSTTASSSNAAVATVTTASGAAAGSYRVQVSALAQAQTVVSPALQDSRADLGAGTLSIEIGSWSAAGDAFTPKSGTSATTVTLPASPSSLEAVRDRINAAQAGVTASILRDATGARLVVKSNATGAINGVRITASGDPPQEPAPPGLAALAYDPAAGSSGMTLAQAGTDAQATLNGVPVTSSTNVLEGVVDGITITLHQTSATPADLTVAADTAGMKKALSDFAAAYTDATQYIAGQTAYDASAHQAQPLQGDASTLQLQRQLRNALSASSGASSLLPRLLDVGLHLDANNALVLDSTRADLALAHPEELAKAFTQAADDPAQTGFGVRFTQLTSQLLDSDGLLARRSQALSATIQRSQDRQQQMTARVNQYQARLLQQYSALDTRMATLDSQASYVSQQVALMTKSSG